MPLDNHLDYIDPGSLGGAYSSNNTWNATPNPLPDPSGGANVSTDGSSPSTFGSDLASIGSGIGNFFNSPLGNLALYGGAAAGLSSEAGSAAKQNAKLAGSISAIGQPSVTAGDALLKSYQAGTLTTPFQNQLNAALTQITQQATSEQQGAAQALANSGGGANIQSAQFGANQQIDAQKQMLTQQAIAGAFTQELTAAEGLISTGGPYVENGILAAIQSNEQLQAQFAQLFSGLASAYAQGPGGTGRSGTQGSPGQNPISNIINQGRRLLNSGSSFSPDQSYLSNTFAGDVASQGGYGLASDLGAVGGGAGALAGYGGDLFGGGTQTASIIAPQVGDVLASDVGSTVAADVGGSAATDLGSFSAGSAAAGAAGGGATAAVTGGEIAAATTPASLGLDADTVAAIDSAAGSSGATSAALASLGGAAIGAGAIGGAYLLGNYLTSLDVPTPQQTARTLSNELFNNPNTNSIQRAAQVASGSKPYTGTTDVAAEAWLQANIGMGGSSLAQPGHLPT